MPQLIVMMEAVSAAIASVRGDFSATFRSAVRPVATKTAPATGIDQMMRCAMISGAGICAIAFMNSGRKPQRK